MKRILLILMIGLLCLPMFLIVTPRVRANETVIFQDNFESYSVGTFPSSGGWQLIYNGAGTQYQVITSDQAASGTKSLQMEGESGWSAVVAKDFSSSSNLIGFEAYLMGTPGAWPSVGFGNETIQPWGRIYGAVGVDTIDGYIVAGPQNLEPCTANTWYKIREVMDRNAGTFDVWINDQLEGTNITEPNNPWEIQSLRFDVGWHNVMSYYDDVEVFEVSGPSGPAISSVSPITANRLQTIDITGSGFMNTQPQTVSLGDGSVDTVNSTTTPSLDINDFHKWGAGWIATGVSCAIGIIINSWSDNEVVLGGFGTALSTNGQGTWNIAPGDTLTVTIHTPYGHASYEVTVTGATYNVFFDESGISNPAQVWSVSLDGYGTEYSNGPGNTIYTITFAGVANGGPYQFTVTPPSGFIAQPTADLITVNGGDLHQPITFNPSPTTYNFELTTGLGGDISYTFSLGLGIVPFGQSQQLIVPPNCQFSLTAIPDSTHIFQSWSTTGSVVISDPSSASTTATVNGNGGTTANFIPVGSISGEVFQLDSQGNVLPIQGATVSIDSTTTKTTTDANGMYSFQLPYGQYMLVCTMSNFPERDQNAEINATNPNVSLHFCMKAQIMDDLQAKAIAAVNNIDTWLQTVAQHIDNFAGQYQLQVGQSLLEQGLSLVLAGTQWSEGLPLPKAVQSVIGEIVDEYLSKHLVQSATTPLADIINQYHLNGTYGIHVVHYEDWFKAALQQIQQSFGPIDSAALFKSPQPINQEMKDYIQDMSDHFERIANTYALVCEMIDGAISEIEGVQGVAWNFFELGSTLAEVSIATIPLTSWVGGTLAAVGAVTAAASMTIIAGSFVAGYSQFLIPDYIRFAEDAYASVANVENSLSNAFAEAGNENSNPSLELPRIQVNSGENPSFSINNPSSYEVSVEPLCIAELDFPELVGKITTTSFMYTFDEPTFSLSSGATSSFNMYYPTSAVSWIDDVRTNITSPTELRIEVTVYAEYWQNNGADYTARKQTMIWTAIEYPANYDEYVLHSPCDLHIYDSNGNHDGINYTSGEAECQIPHSFYIINGTQTIMLLDPSGVYTVRLIGTGNGTYHLEVRSISAGVTTSDRWINGTITDGQTIDYDVRIGSSGVPMFMLNASVDFQSNTLNLESKGKWITAYVELPIGFDVADINVSSITLNNTIPVFPDGPTHVGYNDTSNVKYLMIEFNRTAVIDYILSKGIKYANVTLTLTGRLLDGTSVAGNGAIRVSALVGDVNCDGKVDILDIVQAANCFYAREGETNWNSNANFASPWDVINILDIVTISSHYGQKYP
jgi:hypothetical protein